ncbi:MAG: hypothetical protein ACREIA_14130 [Opitutaceae bacterium]
MDASRRNFCQTGLVALAGLGLASSSGIVRMAEGRDVAPTSGKTSRRPKIAAITVRYGLRLHADNLVTRLLEGYWINDKFHEPRCEVASLYVHHLSDYSPDVSRRLVEACHIRSSPTIADALTLGTGSLGVDGVLIVSEDGLTPWRENPFLSFYSEFVDVFQESGRSVPVLNDKALSCDWNEAQWMVRQSCELDFPLLAGSTVPITFRRPELEFPLGARFDEALVAATLPGTYVESIGCHCIELLQAMVERRAGARW